MKHRKLGCRIMMMLAVTAIGSTSIQAEWSAAARTAEVQNHAGHSEKPVPVVLKLNSYVAPMEQPAVRIDNVLYVPFRDLFELFEGEGVKWEGKQASAVLKIGNEDTRIAVKIGEAAVWINDKEMALESSVRLINGKAMIPLQKLGEALGARLEWDEAKTTATLYRKGLVSVLKPEVRIGASGAFPIPTPPSLSELSDEGKKIAWIDNYLTKNKYNGTALIARKGHVLLNKGFGTESEVVSNEPHTKFRLMSVSKQFTAAAILQLEEQGKLSLQDPIGKYAQDLSFGNKVTLHHLLSHTSGLPREYNRSSDYTLDQLVNDLREVPLDSEPGSTYSYSNVGYALLAYVIEKVSGESYGDYMKKHIFTPLGMNNSGQYLAAAPPAHMAQGYWNDGEKLRKDAEHFSLPGGGDLYSTTEDLLLWERALYAGTILKQSTIQKMHTPNMNSYGYGVHIGMDGSYSHEGSGSGFSTYFYQYPKGELTVILLSNVSDVEIDDVGEVFAAMLK